MGMGETRTLAGFAADLRFDALPPRVVEKARLTLLDYLGTSLLSAQEQPARILTGVVRDFGGAAEAGVIGADLRTSAPWAALVNGALGHMCELDDTHRGTMAHVGDCVWAAALAVGQHVGACGPDIATAAAAGYEVAIRVGEAVMPTHYRRGWHPSGTVTTFGAAAAAGKLLRLDAGRMASALGIAGTQAAGFFAHLAERAMTKDFNPGRAAMNGVLAARLAASGFTGPTDALESPRGFGALYAAEWRPDAALGGADESRPALSVLAAGRSDRFAILEVAHKPYTACRHIHAAIDATLALLGEHGLRAEDVRGATARIFRTGAVLVDDPAPWDGAKGLQGTRFSAQFNLAVVLREGRRGLDALFDHDEVARRVADPAVRAEMRKVTVVADEELDAGFPRSWATVVAIETVRGDRYVRRVDLPLGEPEIPMSPDDLERKFRRVTGLAGLPADAQERAARLVRGLIELPRVDDLIALLQGVSGAPRARTA